MGRTKELYQETIEREENFRRDEEEYNAFWEQVQQTQQETNSSKQ